jgi:phage FluMu gp28-like protein
VPTPDQIQASLALALDQFLPYQKRYIADRTRFVVNEKAVRTGITYSHAFKSSWKRVFYREKKSNELFASKNRTTASEYLGYLKKWAEFWNAVFGEKIVDLSTWTSEIARFPYGDVLILSSDPNAFRGMEGDVTLDEFAFHEQQSALFSAAQSRIQWLTDGQVSLISSHSHPETTFMRLAERARAGRENWSHHRIDLYEAVRQGLALKVPGLHQKLLVAA